MKMKFFKTLAIACVLCMAFATLTAFADVTVVTTTTYDFEAQYDDDTTNDDMVVTTTVTGLEENGEITYYVTNGNKIVFIDQKTAENKKAEFVFKASYGDAITAVAKNGSDKGYTGFKSFTFNEGCNYLSTDTAEVYELGANNGTVSSEHNGYIFQGKVRGPVTEYGVKLKLAGDTEYTECAAKGCDIDGTFAVVLQNITSDEAATAVLYVK